MSELRFLRNHSLHRMHDTVDYESTGQVPMIWRFGCPPTDLGV